MADSSAWKRVLYWTSALVSLPAELVLNVLPVLGEIDDVESPLDRKHTRSFLTEASTVAWTSQKLIDALGELSSKHGGFLKWFNDFKTLASLLRQPNALLLYLLQQSRIYLDEKGQLAFREYILAQLSYKEGRPTVVRILAELNDLQIAQDLLPKLLDDAFVVATTAQGFGFGGGWSYRSDHKITFPHITHLLQSFGFNHALCDTVLNFITAKMNSPPVVPANNAWGAASNRRVPSTTAIYMVWSMLMEQSSLYRSRMVAVKNIAHFGRLIGTAQLSDRKRACLSLVLNVSNFASTYYFGYFIYSFIFLLYNLGICWRKIVCKGNSTFNP